MKYISVRDMMMLLAEKDNITEEDLEHMPKVDITEGKMTRCKDCEYLDVDTYENGDFILWCNNFGYDLRQLGMNECDYCSQAVGTRHKEWRKHEWGKYIGR